MKKILALLTVGLLTSSIVPSVSNVFISGNNSSLENSLKIAENWTLNGININHSVSTPSSGTHPSSNIATDTSVTTTVPWTNFSQYQQVEAIGYFALHPYDGAEYYNSVMLKMDTVDKSQNSIEWDYTKTDDQWRGWGHQTSTITLKVVAKNNANGIISFAVSSYIYARTAGSIHACSTTSQISSLEFIGPSTNK